MGLGTHDSHLVFLFFLYRLALALSGVLNTCILIKNFPYLRTAFGSIAIINCMD